MLACEHLLPECIQEVVPGRLVAAVGTPRSGDEGVIAVKMTNLGLVCHRCPFSGPVDNRLGPVGKALIGSVSQRPLLEAPVPILAVKLNEDR